MVGYERWPVALDGSCVAVPDKLLLRIQGAPGIERPAVQVGIVQLGGSLREYGMGLVLPEAFSVAVVEGYFAGR